MRYEFEVGDYVEIIANESNSSHPIGYIGKITRIDIFPKVELANTSIISKYVPIKYWANLDEHPSGWSDISEIKISTKEAYEAYHKPKLPEYVECIYNEGPLSNELILGKIYKVDLIKSTDDDLWLIGFGTGIYRGLNPPASTNYGGYSGFKFSSKEAFDAQNKLQPKFKIGDWVYFTGKGDSIITSTWYIGKIGKIKSIEKLSFGYNVGFDGCSNEISGFRLATESEIKEYLLKEADRRGFKAGVSYIPTAGGSSETALYNPRFYHSRLSVYDLECGLGRGLIYKDTEDKWATIVPKDKELCGYKVVKPEGSSIISIGCKSISRGEIQGFLNVCDKFNITGVYSEFVKGQSIGLDAIKEALK